MSQPPADTPAPSSSITELLQRAQSGDRAASDALARAVYEDLRTLASRHLSGERADHSLQPTALVHEAYMRLVGLDRIEWKNRTHFFATAANIMRRVLVDHARRTRAGKREGVRVTLDDSIGGNAPLEVLRVNDALEALEALDPRQARIVELRFFVGLTLDETAQALDISPATVSREWSLARAFLHDELLDA